MTTELMRGLDELEAGGIRDLLKHKFFPMWDVFAADGVIREELVCPTTEYLKSKVQCLAKRAFYAEDRLLFSDLAPIWEKYGSNSDEVKGLVQDRDTFLNLWPNATIYWSERPSHTIAFSDAYGHLLKKLSSFSDHDVFRQLHAPDPLHTGFPIVQKDPIQAFNESIWIHPSGSLSSSTGEVDKLWSTLQQNIFNQLKLTNVLGSDVNLWSLPGYLHALIQFTQKQLQIKKPEDLVKTLDSAGLAIAMQGCADLSNRPLPRGIGFTGRWQDGKLHGVTNLQAKMRAAKRAGVVLMFACQDASERDDPNKTKLEAIPGISLVLLPEGWTLTEVIRAVNQVCAESGITEYRWRQAEGRLRFQRTDSFTPCLPDAGIRRSRNKIGEEITPNGEIEFVGAESRLRELEKFVSSGARDGRQLLMLVANQREGKTTLLSKYASKQAMYPCWFSFRRTETRGQTFVDLKNGISRQIVARYVVVTPHPSATEPELVARIADLTNARVFAIVDGIDEAGAETKDPITRGHLEHDVGPKQVCAYLGELQKGVSVLAGTQNGSFVKTIAKDAKLHLPIKSLGEPSKLIDELIARYAAQWASETLLDSERQKLEQPIWQIELHKYSVNNLWVLDDYLDGIGPDTDGLPDSPADLANGPLRGDPDKYFSLRIQEVVDSFKTVERENVERFLVARSWLDDTAWSIDNTATLAGLSPEGIEGSWWSGPLLRLLVTDRRTCQFKQPIIRKAVRDKYPDKIALLCRRCKELIASSRQGQIFDFAVRSLVRFLGAADFSDIWTVLTTTNWLQKRLQLELGESNEIGEVINELAMIRQLANGPAVNELDQLLVWLNCRRKIIEENPAIVGDLIALGGTATFRFHQTATASSRLLRPINQDKTFGDYSNANADQHLFSGTACVVANEQKSFFVVAGVNTLYVYEEFGAAFSYCKPIPIMGGRQITHLASADFPFVYATTTAKSGLPADRVVDSVIRIDLFSTQQMPLVEAKPDMRFRCSAQTKQGIVVATYDNNQLTRHTQVVLQLHDRYGQCLKDDWFTLEHRNGGNEFEETDFQLLTWGEEGFAIFCPGNYEGPKIYALKIEERDCQQLNLHDTSLVHGLMLGSDRSLIWMQIGGIEDDSPVGLLHVWKTADSEVEIFEIDYQDLEDLVPEDNDAKTDSKSLRQRKSRRIPWHRHLVPVGWQEDGSLILHLKGTSSDESHLDDRCFSLSLEHEAIPNPCNYDLLKHLGGPDLKRSLIGPNGNWYRIYGSIVSRLNPNLRQPIFLEWKYSQWWRGVTAGGKVLIKRQAGKGQSASDWLVSSPLSHAQNELAIGDGSYSGDRFVSRNQVLRVYGSQVMLASDDGTETIAFDAADAFLGWGEQMRKSVEGHFDLLNENPELIQHRNKDERKSLTKTIKAITNFFSQRPLVTASSAAVTSHRSLWVIVQTEEQPSNRYFFVRTQVNDGSPRVAKILQIDIARDAAHDESEGFARIEICAKILLSYEPNLQFKRVKQADDEFEGDRQSPTLTPSIHAATENFILIDVKLKNPPHAGSSQHFLLDVSDSIPAVEFAPERSFSLSRPFSLQRPLAFVLDGENLDIIGNTTSTFLGSEESWFLCAREGVLETRISIGEFSSTVFLTDKLDSINVGELRWQLLCLVSDRIYSLRISTLSYSRLSGKWAVNHKSDRHPLEGSVKCIDFMDGMIAIGFDSGKIEIRRKDDWSNVYKYCYLSNWVRHLSICQEDGRTMLAAFNGELHWFLIE